MRKRKQDTKRRDATLRSDVTHKIFSAGDATSQRRVERYALMVAYCTLTMMLLYPNSICFCICIVSGSYPVRIRFVSGSYLYCIWTYSTIGYIRADRFGYNTDRKTILNSDSTAYLRPTFFVGVVRIVSVLCRRRRHSWWYCRVTV